jgi:hypothetical protein
VGCQSVLGYVCTVSKCEMPHRRPAQISMSTALLHEVHSTECFSEGEVSRMYICREQRKGICLALCLRLLLGDIGFVYPVMSMMVIGPSLSILRQRR